MTQFQTKKSPPSSSLFSGADLARKIGPSTTRRFPPKKSCRTIPFFLFFLLFPGQGQRSCRPRTDTDYAADAAVPLLLKKKLPTRNDGWQLGLLYRVMGGRWKSTPFFISSPLTFFLSCMSHISNHCNGTRRIHDSFKNEVCSFN